MRLKPNTLIVVAGPTASGKTTLAIQIANAVDGEIVSADSMQIYRGVGIATAKPTPEELAAIDPALRVPGTTLIMGAVDAVLVEGDHAVLLDYKTDRVAAPQELTGRYALQLKLYAAMVRRQFGLPVTEAVLYSFCLGQAVKVELCGLF